jgi:hypothetical protein
MYTIKNLVDDKNIFPYEYGVTSRDECSSQLTKFYLTSKELRSEVDNCCDFMTKSGTRHFMNYFTAYLNYGIRLRYPRDSMMLEIKNKPELRKAMDPIAEFLCLEKKQKKEWIKGIQSGQGILTNEFRDKYVGEIKNFLPNGKGILTFPNGGKYEGEFKDGEFHGLGKLGSVYEGNFKNGLKHGQGTGTIEGKFIGQWKYGWKHDRGTYFDSDGGVIYECEYNYEKIYGKGTQYKKDGSKIIFEHRKMIFPYDHMSKIWNQTEYCPDGKIIEMVKDGEYLEDDNLESVGTP